MIHLVTRMARLVGAETVAAPVPLPPGVVMLRSRLVPAIGGWLAGMRGPAAAVTLGRVILIRPDLDPTPRLVRHEIAHVRQWERHPRTFPFRYIAAHIHRGYGGNPYEAEARAAETGRSGGDGE